MSDDKKLNDTRDLALETNEVAGDVLLKAGNRAGREVGEVSDDEIERILAGEVETGDNTREIDVRAYRGKKSGSA